jgi:UPF0755 protein
MRDVRAALAKAEPLVHDAAKLDDTALMAKLGHPGQHPEGRFLPETYVFTRGDGELDVLRRAHASMQKALDAAWRSRRPDSVLKTPDEMLTLASIVEKETGKANERSRVAAVFINRLQKKMRLQSDPTIIYGLVGGKGTLGRPIKRSEITQPSPYNTYVVEGLPPGPIANPGRASLEATANPARTRDLYFVADGTGGHTFTETYDQHQKNVAKLRTLEKQIQNDTVEPSDEPTTGTATPAGNAPQENVDAPPKAAPATQPQKRGRKAAHPAREGAAQSTTSPPVVQR